jgi:hypothetical protein
MHSSTEVSVLVNTLPGAESSIAYLVPSEHREASYEGVCDKLLTSVWPPLRCACKLAATEWRALPMDVR